MKTVVTVLTVISVAVIVVVAGLLTAEGFDVAEAKPESTISKAEIASKTKAVHQATVSEKIVTKALNSLKAGDLTEFSDFAGSDFKDCFAADGLAQVFGTDQQTTAAFVKAWCQGARYSVVSSTQSGDKATVTLKVSGLELMSYLQNTLGEYQQKATSGLGEFAGMSREEITRRAFKDTLAHATSVDHAKPRDITVTFTKRNGTWEVDDPIELAAAMFPGYLS